MNTQPTKESILIADDNPKNLDVLSAMLKPKGYDIREAQNGEQALESIRYAPPDLVLLDIHMPGMDGYEVCDALQSDPGLKNIPVIFISALSESFNKVIGFRKGAVDYIEKPFQMEELEIRVETQLKLLALRRRLAARVKSSEERFRVTFENAAVGIAHIGLDGSVIRVNRCLCTILGTDHETLTKKTLSQLRPPGEATEEITDLRHLFDHPEAVIRKEERVLRQNGEMIWCRMTLSLAKDIKDNLEYGILVLEDISDRIMAEENRTKMEGLLRQSQRMEAIGTLAGGIAHDFNNILGVIMGYTEIIEMNPTDSSLVESSISAIQTATLRARDLVGHILTTCRQAEHEKKAIAIEPVVEETLGLLRASLPAVITIKSEIAPCDPVLADPTQIHQVLMNLCTNAFHAMADRGGTLEVNLVQVTLDGHCDPAVPDLGPGEYNLIEVSDTGTGIPARELEKIFDPYFTTKPKGKGTGLGLSVVHGIVKSHHGEIVAYSQENIGTTFKVYLPCDAKEPPSLAPSNKAPVLGGNESVLVVDDDGEYLVMMADLLSNFGYSVTTERNGKNALERLRDTRFDCLITDMTMPGMTGVILTARARDIQPNLPVIMFTGFSEIISQKRARQIGINALLMKHVSPARVAATLRSVLGRP